MRGLFGVALAGAHEFAIETAFHHEDLAVFRALFRDGDIVWGALVFGLHIFLEDALVIDEFVAGDRGLIIHQDMVFDESGGCRDTAIQIDGADHGFHGVREDGGFACASGAVFFRAEQDIFAEVEVVCLEGEIGFGDDLGFEFGELALLLVRMAGKELARDHKTEDGIAQEFHAFKG